jgi:hypothetical protein
MILGPLSKALTGRLSTHLAGTGRLAAGAMPSGSFNDQRRSGSGWQCCCRAAGGPSRRAVPGPPSLRASAKVASLPAGPGPGARGPGPGARAEVTVLRVGGRRRGPESGPGPAATRASVDRSAGPGGAGRADSEVRRRAWHWQAGHSGSRLRSRLTGSEPASEPELVMPKSR